MAYIVMAYIAIAYTVMAYIVIAYMVMAYIVIAYIVMASAKAVAFVYRHACARAIGDADTEVREYMRGHRCGLSDRRCPRVDPAQQRLGRQAHPRRVRAGASLFLLSLSLSPKGCRRRPGRQRL